MGEGEEVVWEFGSLGVWESGSLGVWESGSLGVWEITAIFTTPSLHDSRTTILLD